jgi:HlyD family secretion protein
MVQGRITWRQYLNQQTKTKHAPLENAALGGSPPVATPDVEGARGPLVPVPLPIPRPLPKRRRWSRIALTCLAFALAAGGGAYYWWKQSQDQLPPGIVSSNGRIEADEIDIDTKFAGRLAELLADEGDMVTAGQVVARMDTRDLEASLKRAGAQVLQAQRAVDEARATQEQQETQVALAKQQLDRTSYLLQRGNATQELYDQRRQQLDGATAALNAATARVAQTEHALNAAQHEVELLNVNIADNTLVAPRDGRVQYRIANIGEVLPAGGKVLTMIDISSVYMDIYLPTLDAGRAKIGTEARIVLDAYPNIVIPAKVSFVATQSQFTPKTVETQTERERLMFRVRVRIDPALLRAHAAAVRSGLPGVAYLRLDPNMTWPARLQPTLGS